MPLSISEAYNLKDKKMSEFLFALFKGSPGSRKSTAAASFPDPLFIDSDGKSDAVQKIFPDKDIRIICPRNFDEHLDILDELSRNNPYQTIVDDSITTTSTQIFNLANKYRGKEMVDSETPGGKRESKTARMMKGMHIEMPQIEDYKMELRALEMMTDYLRIIHQNGANVILTAHVLSVRNEDIKTKVVTTKNTIMTGGQKSACLIPAMFKEVYHFYSKSMELGGKEEYFVNTESTGDDYAMTALKLPPTIKWTGKNFYDLIQKSIKGEDNPFLSLTI